MTINDYKSYCIEFKILKISNNKIYIRAII